MVPEKRDESAARRIIRENSFLYKYEDLMVCINVTDSSMNELMLI